MTMEQLQTQNNAAGGLSAVDRCVRAPAPRKGLTFRKGKREANVHEVKDGIGTTACIWTATTGRQGYTRPRSTSGTGWQRRRLSTARRSSRLCALTQNRHHLVHNSNRSASA